MDNKPSGDVGPTASTAVSSMLAQAYRKYARYWMNLARTANSSDDEAKDIVHGVMSNILTGPERHFKSLEHLRNYVARSVLNHAIQARQRTGRQVPWDEAVDVRFAVEQLPVEVNEAERMRVFREGVNRLPKMDFEIIKLRFYCGYTFLEISNLLGLPISTLKSREDRAMRKMKKWLRKNGF